MNETPIQKIGRYEIERETREAAEAARMTSEAGNIKATAGATQTAAEGTRMAYQTQTATQIAKYRVGDIIKFGRYEQDNNLSNGAEEIEWRILVIESDTALLVSVMGLDAKPYNEDWGNIKWADCTLRVWLNNEFYNTAFDENERKKIELTHVVNEDNSYRETKGGNDTEDYIFLLSIAEVEKYFSTWHDRIAKLTDYAIANGAWLDENRGSGWWWLRSPGYIQINAAGVNSDGDILTYGEFADSDDYSVRPAMRIKLK